MKKRTLKKQPSKKPLPEFKDEQIPIKQTGQIKGGDGDEGDDQGIVVVDVVIP